MKCILRNMLGKLGGQGWKSALWWVLGFAIVIRLLGIDYGLPFIYWTDEYHEVMRALELGSGEFNLSRTGKGGFYFLLFFEYGLYYVSLKLTGVVSTAQDFAEQFVRDPSVFYLMGRVTAAVFGCATVAAAYYVARLASDARAGLLAGLFLAVNVLHVGVSHRVGVDVPMTLFATLALYFGLRVAVDGKRGDYVLAGICAALATTTKLPGILVLLPLVIAHAYRVSGSPQGLRSLLASRDFWLAAAVFILVLGMTNPGIFLHAGYLSLYSPSSDEIPGDEAAEAAAGAIGSIRPNLYFFYLNVLQDSMGWPLFALAAVSIGYAAWKHTPPDVMLISYALINYLAIASTTSEILYYPRYALPIIVVLVILAGRALSDAIEFIPGRRMFTTTIATAAVIAWPMMQALENTYLLMQTDTRTIAKEWFDAHVPAGSKVLIEGGKIAASRLTVPLADSLQSLDQRIAYWSVKEPRQAKFLRLERAVYEGGGFELELVQVASIEPFDDYAARGTKYFVIRPDTFMGARKAEMGSARLLKRLRSDRRVTLVKRFEASNSRPGPTIEVYEFKSELAPHS